MRYGYGRVSSRGQKLYGTSCQDQKDLLMQNGIPEDCIFFDTYTGTEMSREGFDQLLSILQPGDELMVCKLDRLARTAAEGSLLVKELVSKGIRVNILNMGVADNTPMGKMMVTILFAFAEYERDMIVERTSAGKAYKREHDPNWTEGRKRKKTECFNDVREKQARGELTIDSACAMLGISKSTYFRRVREEAVC